MESKRRPIPVFIGMLMLVVLACTSSSNVSGTAEPVATDTPTTSLGGGTSEDGLTPVAPSATPNPLPTQKAGSVTATPPPATATEQPFELSESELPTAPVTFQVQVPENTPPGEPVYVMVDTVDAGYTRAHVELSPAGSGIYSGEVDLPVGALVRYAYDRWDEVGCCADTRITRESLFTGDPIGYRSLIVEQGGGFVVRDVVPQWNDLETDFQQVEVTGRIVDWNTSEPLMDVDVTVAGVHVATDFEGRFSVPGIVPGVHRIVATTAKGDYRAIQQEIEVGETGLAFLPAIRMQRAPMLPVTFTVQLPEGTPPDAGVFVAGNLRQLGARPLSTNLPSVPSGISMPQMSREGDRATLTLDLPAGAYVEYFYTLGSDVSAEVDRASRVFRNFIVGEAGSERNDAAVWWGNEGWPLTTLRVDVPVNTPEGVPVYLRNGPTYRMNQLNSTQWVTVIGSHPPGSEYRFSISLGDDMYGKDGSPGLDVEGNRSITVPGESSEVPVKVTKWASLPDPTLRDDRGGLTVTFRLSIPPETPENATIVLTGDRPAVGANGTVMSQVPGNPWLYEADVNFGHDGPMRYRYTVSETERTSGELTVDTDYHGQEVNDYVAAWDGGVEPREGWVSGLFLPDFWSESFLPTSDSAFEAGHAVNGEWVAISSVWSFGEILPEPFIESRPVRIWTVLTPIDDIRAQAEVAREQGMKIFLAPQMNPEVLPDWQDQTVSAGSREWWEQWLEQAEAQWMWNALVGEEIGAEMLMLPGYVFHVFPPPSFFHDESYAPEFDLKVQELIAKVREVYSGKILISGGQTSYDFPGLADYVGVTTYDIGVPDLPSEASVADFQAYYSAGFEQKVDPLWDRWGKPVMLYTIHADSKAGAGDEFGQLYQAAAYEAMFQEIAERPFMAGSFSWAFDYVGAWQFDTSGVRDRAAGAVMAKWYERLGG